jgi:hypothetical protein
MYERFSRTNDSAVSTFEIFSSVFDVGQFPIRVNLGFHSVLLFSIQLGGKHVVRPHNVYTDIPFGAIEP